MNRTKFLKKVFMISRIAGMCPFSFKDGLPRIDYLVLPYSIVIMLWVCSQSIRFLIKPSYFASDKVLTITLTIQNLAFCCNVVSSYLCLLFARDSLRSTFLNFMDADVYFAKLGKKPSYNINLFYDFMLILFGSTLSFYCYTQQWKYIFIVAEIIQYHYLVLSIFISVQPFIKLVCLLKNRFRMLNSTVVELSSSQFGQSEVLETILKLHDILCRACEDLNKSFSLQLLFTIIISFSNLSVGVHYTIVQASKSPLTHNIFRIISICSHMFRIILLTSECKTTADEANQLHILLSERLWNEDIRKIENIGKVEACLLMKRRVEFKGYGFLVLDHTLLLSILGAGTTYLVILLQVGKESAVNTLGSGPNYNVTTAINN
ncbi:Gustatory receptor 79b [Halyomorpha halys]|nr:Gustatory receptor 79b [Halyomorpha halys]